MALTTEEIKAITDGFTTAIQPLADAITALVAIEKADPEDAASVENTTKSIVTAAIEPALTAMNAASDALKASSDTMAAVVTALSKMPAQNDAGSVTIYGVVAALDNSDANVEKGFVS